MNYSVSKFTLKSQGFQQGAVLALGGHLAISRPFGYPHWGGGVVRPRHQAGSGQGCCSASAVHRTLPRRSIIRPQAPAVLTWRSPAGSLNNASASHCLSPALPSTGEAPEQRLHVAMCFCPIGKCRWERGSGRALGIRLTWAQRSMRTWCRVTCV